MGYYDGPGGGAGLLAATLKKNFNLDVDNYIVQKWPRAYFIRIQLVRFNKSFIFKPLFTIRFQIAQNLG
jgi:hypothetical protein